MAPFKNFHHKVATEKSAVFLSVKLMHTHKQPQTMPEMVRPTNKKTQVVAYLQEAVSKIEKLINGIIVFQNDLTQHG